MQNLLKKYIIQRLQPERKFDQFYANTETLLKRTELILKFNPQEVVFLGDDDLTSIALILHQKNLKITVIDIDQRILNLIQEISRKENLNIETINYDLRKPLEINLKTNFIFFDPPYTPQALKLWLIRALEILLSKGSNQKRKSVNFLKDKFIFMCYGYTDKSTERGLKVQEIITSLGLVIQEKFRKFNKYTGAESINNESDLYVLQPTPKIDLKLIDSFRKKEFKEKIYTWEVNFR